MEVERDTDLLAGGASDNLETGEYTLTASDWKPGNTPAGEKQAETDSLAPWQDRELVAMARAYYQKGVLLSRMILILPCCAMHF